MEESFLLGLDGHVREAGLNSGALIFFVFKKLKICAVVLRFPNLTYSTNITEGKGCTHLLYLCDLTHITHTQKLMILDYESQNNNVSLSGGTRFLQGILGF